MRKQKLLENDREPDLFFSIFCISILLFFSILSSVFLKRLKVEEHVFAGGLLTFLVETGIVFFAFLKYPEYFKKIFSRFPLFFTGLKYYLIVIPLLLIAGSITYSIFSKFHIKVETQKIISFYLKTDSIELIFFIFFLSCFIAPFTEEIIFRGLLYKSIRKVSSFPIAMVLNSLIFALFHNTLFTFAGIFILGCVLSILFEKKNSIWPSIGLHFFNNFFTNIFLIIFKFIYS